MNRLTLMLCTLAATVSLVLLRPEATAAEPPSNAAPPRIEVVFVLDTTGSMGGMIQAAKDRIWSIASTMAQARPAPDIRIGLVAYRDQGDAYVTRLVPLSADLDAVFSQLMSFDAGGGGDTPEAVNQALHDAVHNMTWSDQAGVYRTIFLVGDAPGHADRPQEIPWETTLATARSLGIVVNTVLCGDNADASVAWQQIAAANQGRFLAVDVDGGALRIDTPVDTQLAALAEELDATRLWYGRPAERERKAEKAADEAASRAAAPASAKASRGIYHASAAGTASYAASADLLSELERGTVEIETLDDAELPETLQSLTREERRKRLDLAQARRDNLRRQIGELASQREAFIESARAEMENSAQSLDAQLFETLRDQAVAVGLELEPAAVPHERLKRP